MHLVSQVPNGYILSFFSFIFFFFLENGDEITDI